MNRERKKRGEREKGWGTEKAKTLDKSSWGSNSHHSLYVIAFITGTWLEFESSEFARTRVAHSRDVLCGTWGHILRRSTCVRAATSMKTYNEISPACRKFSPNTHADYLQIVCPTRRRFASFRFASRPRIVFDVFASNLSFSFVLHPAMPRWTTVKYGCNWCTSVLDLNRPNRCL